LLPSRILSASGWRRKDASRLWEVLRRRGLNTALANASDPASGFAVLADRKGGAHFLLIPTRTMTGIESSEAAEPTAINYFAAAWDARDVLQTKTGYPIPRQAVGLAINSQRARGQDQLHIHIECVGRELFAALQANVNRIGDSWSSIEIADSPFIAMRIPGEKLEHYNPFALLAHLVATNDATGNYTLIVAGAKLGNELRFIVLAGRKGPNGESLLDSTCAMAR